MIKNQYLYFPQTVVSNNDKVGAVLVSPVHYAIDQSTNQVVYHGQISLNLSRERIMHEAKDDQYCQPTQSP